MAAVARDAHAREWVPLLAEIALLGVLYYAGGVLGLRLYSVSAFAAPVWPPTGIALAAILLRGTRVWPGIVIGALSVNLAQGAAWPVALGIAAGNTLESLVAAHVLHRTRFELGLGRVRDVLALAAAGLVSAPISATNGIAWLLASHTTTSSVATATWVTWLVGDLLSVLVVAPLLVTTIAGLRGTATWRETIAAHATVTVCAIVILGGVLPPLVSRVFGRAHLMYPVLLWPSLRLGPRGTAIASAIVSVVALTATTLHRGPFATAGGVSGLLALQVFVGVIATTHLVLAAAVTESRFRDRLLSIAAHELRGPIGTLGLSLQTLHEGLHRGWPVDRCTRAAEMATKQVRRLAGLVAELLDATKVGSQRLSLHPVPVDLAEIAGEVASRMRDELGAVGCPVTIRAAPTIGAWDPLRVDQVLTNLLSNAMRHAPHAPITIEIRRLGDHARLTVTDGGPGIAVRDQARIFDAFRSLDRHGVGLGLGLHIAREIVCAHGGTITVRSTPGQGATFVVDLPLASAGPARRGDRVPTGPRPSRA